MALRLVKTDRVVEFDLISRQRQALDVLLLDDKMRFYYDIEDMAACSARVNQLRTDVANRVLFSFFPDNMSFEKVKEFPEGKYNKMARVGDNQVVLVGDYCLDVFTDGLKGLSVNQRVPFNKRIQPWSDQSLMVGFSDNNIFKKFPLQTEKALPQKIVVSVDGSKYDFSRETGLRSMAELDENTLLAGYSDGLLRGFNIKDNRSQVLKIFSQFQSLEKIKVDSEKKVYIMGKTQFVFGEISETKPVRNDSFKEGIMDFDLIDLDRLLLACPTEVFYFEDGNFKPILKFLPNSSIKQIRYYLDDRFFVITEENEIFLYGFDGLVKQVFYLPVSDKGHEVNDLVVGQDGKIDVLLDNVLIRVSPKPDFTKLLSL